MPTELEARNARRAARREKREAGAKPQELFILVRQWDAGFVHNVHTVVKYTTSGFLTDRGIVVPRSKVVLGPTANTEVLNDAIDKLAVADAVRSKDVDAALTQYFNDRDAILDAANTALAG